MKALRAYAILLCLSLFTACGGGSFGPGVPGPSLSLKSIQLAPFEPSISIGQNQQFTATGYYSDGSSKDISSLAAWASSNTGVATISGGIATSRAAGSSTITATVSGVAGYGILTVTNAGLISITITPANPVLLLGTLQQFKATGTFADGSVQDITSTVTWASSNKNFASINAGGLAAALALGSLTISATSGSVTGSTPATVQLAVLSSITVKPAKGKIAFLTTQQFRAIGTYTDGSTHNLTRKVSWTSSDTNAATITSHGLSHGIAPGTTTITATLGSISGSATLEVTNATVVSISVKPTGKTIPPLTRLAFSAVGHFSDRSSQIITAESIWSSDNPAVAIVRGGNTATGVGPGTANISATFEGISGSAPLNVSSATLTSIAVTPANAVLAPTTTVNCVATGIFSDGSTQVITNLVNWTSSVPGVASVGPGGGVTAESGGSAQITAQFGPVTGSSMITVDSSPLTSIQISPPAASIAQQTGTTFRAIGTFADGNTQDLTTSALWTSSTPAVATITAGRASGLTPGTTTITVLFGDQVGTASLTVTAAAAGAAKVSPDAMHFERAGLGQSIDLADCSDCASDFVWF